MHHTEVKTIIDSHQKPLNTHKVERCVPMHEVHALGLGKNVGEQHRTELSKQLFVLLRTRT